MSMSEQYPDGDPNDAYAIDELGAELDQTQSLLRLLDNLHTLHEAGSESDEGNKDIMQGLGKLASFMEVQLFTITDDDDDVAPCTYDEMKWEPQQGTMAAFACTDLLVRFPSLKSEEFSVFDDESDGVTPQDVLVEIHYKAGTNQRFLINDNGIFGYRDATSLEFSDVEMFDPNKVGQRPNVFTVVNDPLVTKGLNVEVMTQFLLEDSRFVPHQ